MKKTWVFSQHPVPVPSGNTLLWTLLHGFVKQILINYFLSCKNSVRAYILFLTVVTITKINLTAMHAHCYKSYLPVCSNFTVLSCVQQMYCNADGRWTGRHITLHSTAATRTQGRHELPVLHTPQTSVLFCWHTVHFLNLPISVLQRVRVRDLKCWIISWKGGERKSKLRGFWELEVWSWYRFFPEQLIVAHLLKELWVIMVADGSSLSHKIPTFTEVNRGKKCVSNWKRFPQDPVKHFSPIVLINVQVAFFNEIS